MLAKKITRAYARGCERGCVRKILQILECELTRRQAQKKEVDNYIQITEISFTHVRGGGGTTPPLESSYIC